MYAAFFKGHSSGLAGLFDIADHLWEEGDYSHVELVLSDGRSVSAVLNGGVRYTTPGSINFDDATQWDKVALYGFSETAALAYTTPRIGEAYDVAGDAHFVAGLVHHTSNTQFCSEFVGGALGFADSWRFDPNALCVTLQRFVTFYASLKA